MGTSFVEYKGFGFWSRDSFLESWLTDLLHEIGKLPKLEPWQKALQDHWIIQAKVDGGCMHVGLDDFLEDRSRQNFVLLIAQNALKTARPLGRRTGELFVDLLVGKVKTIASSPIDYLGDTRP